MMMLSIINKKDLMYEMDELTLMRHSSNNKQGCVMDYPKPIKLLAGHSLPFFLSIFVFIFSHPTSANESNNFDCLIEPEVFIELSSPVNGIVESFLVEKSDFIKKGQVLASLESSVEKATVDLAREKAISEEDIKSKQVKLDFAKRRLNRVEKLYKRNAISIDEKEQADTEVKLAEIELKKARRNKRLAELELKRAKVNLEQRSIKSTISGVVVDRLLEPGESVEDRPILKLAQIDPLRVEVIAPANMIGLIKPGMKASVYPEHPAGSRYEATVSLVDMVVDAASGSFGVSLTLPNPESKLVGGLNCKLNFVTNDGLASTFTWK